MPTGPQNVFNTISSYSAIPKLSSTSSASSLPPGAIPFGSGGGYMIPYDYKGPTPPGGMQGMGGIYYGDVAVPLSAQQPSAPFRTTDQPGIPSLGSTTVIPGSSASQPSPPDYINLLNQLNRQGQQAALGQRIPGGPGLELQSSGNIAQELAGQLPQDVLNLIQQQGAERGVMTGSPGSPNAEAATLAALGLTSLGLQQQGQQDLTAALGRNPAAPLVNLTGMLLTPYEAGELNVRGQQNLSQLGGLNPPAPYTGPGSGEGYLQALPGGSATTPNWWQDIVPTAGGTPSPTPYSPSPFSANQSNFDPMGLTDAEFAQWMQSQGGPVIGTTYGTTSGVPEFDPNLLNWMNAGVGPDFAGEGG